MRYFILFLCLKLMLGSTFAQNRQTDSLKRQLEGILPDTSRINTLIALSSNYYRTEPDEAIRYARLAETLAEETAYREGQAYALKSIGMGYYFKGDFINALVSWQNAMDIFNTLGDKLGVANMLNNLGAVHFNQGDDNKAIEYYLQSLKVSEELVDTLRIATALVNIGAVYFNKRATYDLALRYYLQSLPLSENLGNYDAIGTCAVNIGEIYLARNQLDSALFYFDKALAAYQNSKSGNVPYALNSIGKVYAKKADFETAIDYQQRAYNLAEGNNARLEMAQTLLGLANTYKQKNDIDKSVESFIEARQIAEDINAVYQLKDAYLGLAESYSQMEDYKNAYVYQSMFTNVKDTLYNAEMDKRIQALTLGFEINSKQGQIDLLQKDKALQELDIRRQKTIRNAAAITGLLLLILAGGLFNRYKFIHKTKKIIEGEKAISEKLLLNILPEETAQELKEKGFATPKHYDMVSVLFTDFKGFTKIAEKLSPQELVEELNQCFMEFDHIMDKYNLEKIKTIGDAYMAAGGIPVANSSNPCDVVMAGLEIKNYMQNLKKEREAKGLDYWELRIGIHTGSVIAGVVGKNKFAYDIWGDAVNTASRMESSGVPGKVNISGSTFALIKDEFECTYRGKIQAKNKGEIDMYIVEAPSLNHKLYSELGALKEN